MERVEHVAAERRAGDDRDERAHLEDAVRARQIVRTPPLPPPREPDDGGPTQIGKLVSRWDGRDHDTPIYARARLRQSVAGPALIVEYSATTYLPPGAVCDAVDGCLRISW